MGRGIKLTIALLTFYSADAFAQSGGGTGGGDSWCDHFAGVGKRLTDAYVMICAAHGDKYVKLCKRLPEFKKKHKVLPNDTLTGADGKPRLAGPQGTDIALNTLEYRKTLKNPARAELIVSTAAHEWMIQAGGDKNDLYDESLDLMKAIKTEQLDIKAIFGTPPEDLPAPTRRESAPPSDFADAFRGAVGLHDFVEVKYNNQSFLAVTAAESRDGIAAQAQARRAAKICARLQLGPPSLNTIEWIDGTQNVYDFSEGGQTSELISVSAAAELLCPKGLVKHHISNASCTKFVDTCLAPGTKLYKHGDANAQNGHIGTATVKGTDGNACDTPRPGKYENCWNVKWPWDAAGCDTFVPDKSAYHDLVSYKFAVFTSLSCAKKAVAGQAPAAKLGGSDATEDELQDADARKASGSTPATAPRSPAQKAVLPAK